MNENITEAESATLEALSRSKLGSPSSGNSWLGSLIATIIGNLKISISNVHIRYEDSISNPGNPFACGVTLAKLAAVTTDEQGNETFDTSGALDKLRKSLQLQRLAVYHDPNCLPWKLDKKWEDLSPKEWIEIFEDGISESANGDGMVSTWARDRNYVVSPINGVLKYHRLGNQERNDPHVPFEKASLILSDVSLTITEAQYHDWIKLLEVISRYKTYVEVSHLRPVGPVSEAPSLWWRYAVQAALQQKKMSYRFSWDRTQHLCHLRRRYIQLYAGSLQQFPNVDYSEIRDIEKDLDPKVILLWRFIAHAKVESVKSKEAAEQRLLKKRSWFSFPWRTPTGDASEGNTSERSQLLEERLTKEEWQAINNLLSNQPDEDMTSHSGKDLQNMIHYLVNVQIGQAAARIISINQTEIACGRFEQLHVSTKIKHRTTHCDVTLKFYGLSAPEGSLAQVSILQVQDFHLLITDGFLKFIAHAKVESVKSKEAAEQRLLKKRSWFSFPWRTPTGDASEGNTSERSQLLEERLTKEEWQAINNLLSNQPDEDMTSHSGKDLQNMIHYLVNVQIGQAAARIISINQTEIACGRFEQLHVSTKIKHRTTHCDVTLKFYGLSAPEGSLAQSVSSEQKLNALAASFVYAPVGENVDWRLSATISPCHVTVFMESYNRFLEFLKRSNAVSPTVALETANALQNKIEKVTRRAQEQFQMVLEEQSRFALDIDLDAPKVRVPIRTCASSKCDSHFLVDFGHFTLHTKEGQPNDQGRSLYSRFYISGRDIAAFFTDCGSERQMCTLAIPTYYGQPSISHILEDASDVRKGYSCFLYRLWF
ncbi:unnamed protein product [Ilex paraguariensis]|uniref:Chorein N-terminal domain-containing protein n=1 Tax=Ilex paraguariensis TaxID=185542 RepID=A0ABC8V2K6_9AQUA